MNVEIISRETIKPSSPTPNHLRNYKLCLLDQLAPPIYAPIVLFYSATTQDLSEKSNLLKKSLSETLTNFYPFAGQIKDAFTINCNDCGADYIEARVSGDISTFLKQPEFDQLVQLIPSQISSLAILAVQVSYFDCGGMAIGVSIWHSIGDASSIASFVKNWAAIARGANENIDGVIFDCTSLFPPQDLLGFSTSMFINDDLLPNIVTKRFLFDGSVITSLREKIGEGSTSLDHPTRVEAVSALIWAAAIGVTQENPPEVHVGVNMVDLRRRINPPLPQHCIGNINQMTMAILMPPDKSIETNDLAGEMRKSIRVLSDENLRQLHGNGEYLNFMKEASEMHANGSLNGVFTFSSWCRFGFYETDFGWGKPIWLSSGMRLNNLAVLIDTSDGKGIEAWVGMSKEKMAKFEQDPGILAYASFNPSI